MFRLLWVIQDKITKKGDGRIDEIRKNRMSAVTVAILRPGGTPLAHQAMETP
jgi:hypothetical protein